MTHYATLGVADTATPDEIKSAYRKLAKQHHPDLGGDVTKFQQISEAYEILADADKRAHYDHTLKHPQNQFHFNQGFNGGGFSFHHNFNDDVFRDINDQFSQMFGFNVRTAQQAPRNRNIRIQIDLDFLDTLDSCERTIEYKIANGIETITLKLPAGIQNDTVFQMPGKGDNANPAVPRGNLEVVIKVKNNTKFTKLGDDHIFTERTIDCFQAVLGCDIDIETPRGKTIRLTIPVGTQNATQFGITDEGINRPNNTRGKLIVKINVKIPTALTSEQLDLIKQIQKLRPINT
jgi:curved DNA-binding protein